MRAQNRAFAIAGQIFGTSVQNLSRTLVCEIPGIKICLQARNFILCGLISMREMFHLSALRILLAPVFDFRIFVRRLYILRFFGDFDQ